jgi:hypothetical protein
MKKHAYKVTYLNPYFPDAGSERSILWLTEEPITIALKEAHKELEEEYHIRPENITSITLLFEEDHVWSTKK